MAKRATELGAIAVKNLTERGRHYVGGDGAIGLALQVAPGGSRSWILRTTVQSKRRDIGLGGYPDVPLAEARNAAKLMRAKIRAGIDPVQERLAARSAALAKDSSSITFQAASSKYIAAQELAWKNAKHRQQWANTLETYAYPVIGKMLVSDIKMAHVLQVLEPIAGTNLCFPAPRGGQLSDMTLTAVLRRMDVQAVPHGFRSTFRDWVAEETDYHNHVAEMALAHKIGHKVEAAYRRGDLFDKRAVLMADWAEYCGTPTTGNVVSIRALAS